MRSITSIPVENERGVTLANENTSSSNGIHHPTVGDAAYKELLAFVENTLKFDENDDTWGWPRIVSSSFADLAYLVLTDSGTVDRGTERLHTLLETVIAEPFRTGIREALALVRPEHTRRLLTGIFPYMLEKKIEPELWLPLLKTNRHVPLMIDVDIEPKIGEHIKEMTEFEFYDPVWTENPNRLIVDVVQNCSGSAGLIHALTFQPDFMLVDISFVGLQGPIMMDYINQHPRTRNTPYSVVTAHADVREDPPDMKKFFSNAKRFITKPFHYSIVHEAILCHLA